MGREQISKPAYAAHTVLEYLEVSYCCRNPKELFTVPRVQQPRDFFQSELSTVLSKKSANAPTTMSLRFDIKCR